MSTVGMSHVRCRMYLSNNPRTKSLIWSFGHVTDTFDIVHGTSQQLTFSEGTHDWSRIDHPNQPRRSHVLRAKSVSRNRCDPFQRPDSARRRHAAQSFIAACE